MNTKLYYKKSKQSNKKGKSSIKQNKITIKKNKIKKNTNKNILKNKRHKINKINVMKGGGGEVI